VRKIFVDVIEDESVKEAFYTGEYCLVLVMALFETPFTLVARIEKLRFMGLTGVVSITTFMVTFVVYYILSVLD
jgi:hypothetical protein